MFGCVCGVGGWGCGGDYGGVGVGLGGVGKIWWGFVG